MSTFKTHFNTSAAQYEALRSGYMQTRRYEIVSAALQGAENVSRAVEIGCGTGNLLSSLAKAHGKISFLGLDIDEKLITFAQGKPPLPNARFECVGPEATFPEASCDFIFSVDMLHHVREHPAFLRRTRRMIRPGGRWIVMEPNIWHPYMFWFQERMRRAGHDEDHFRPWSVEPLFREAGFRVLSKGYGIVLPMKLPDLSPGLGRIEKALGRFRFTGTQVIYLLEATSRR